MPSTPKVSKTDVEAALGEEEFVRLCGEWRTPFEFAALCRTEFGLGMDAAASPDNTLVPFRYLTEEDDALSRNWDDFSGTYARSRGPEDSAQKTRARVDWCPGMRRSVWINPPHADFYPWAAKALEQVRFGLIDEVVMLALPSFASVWWTELASRADEIRLLAPRIPFLPPPEFAELGYEGSGNDRERCLVIFRREKRHPVAPYIWTWQWDEELDIPLTKAERED